MVADTSAIWLPPSPAIIRPLTADHLLSSAYWPADPRHRVLAFRDLRDTRRLAADQIAEATTVWMTKDAIIFFAPIFMAGKPQRKFTISPAVAGKTAWDLDVDGPCTLSAAGNYTLTFAGGFPVDFKGNGGGGGGGSAGTGSGSAGGNTTVGSLMTAGGGQGGIGQNSAGGGNGGAGGVAVGGNMSNTNGTAGQKGNTAGSSVGGYGGSSPNGGAQSTSSSANGNPPGGGGAGGNVFGTSGGGGGGGAFCQSLLSLTGVQTLAVGSGGARGAGNANGGTGAVGRIVMT